MSTDIVFELLQKAEKCRAHKNYKEMIKIYKMCVDMKNTDAMYYLGAYFQGRGDNLLMIKYYDMASSNKDIRSACSLGNYYLDNGDNHNAIKYFSKAADMNCINAIHSLVKIYTDIGVKKIVEDYLLKGISLGDPTCAKLFGDIGVENGDYDNAVMYYTIAINMGNIEAIFNLGKLYYEKKDYQNAVNNFMIANNKGCYRAGYYLGKYYEKEDQAKAIYHYNNCYGTGLAIKASCRLGIIAFKSNDFDQALEYFSFADNSKKAALYIGRIFLKLNKINDAITNLENAISLGSLKGYRHLGKIYYSQKKYNAAEDLFRKANIEKTNIKNIKWLLKILYFTHQYNQMKKYKNLCILNNCQCSINIFAAMYLTNKVYHEAENLSLTLLEGKYKDNALRKLGYISHVYHQNIEKSIEYYSQADKKSVNKIIWNYRSYNNGNQHEEEYINFLSTKKMNEEIFNCGILYFEEKNYTRCKYCMKLLVENPDAALYIGHSYLLENKFKKAERYYSRAQKYGGTTTFYFLGLASKLSKDFEIAKEFFLTCISNDVLKLSSYVQLMLMCKGTTEAFKYWEYIQKELTHNDISIISMPCESDMNVYDIYYDVAITCYTFYRRTIDFIWKVAFREEAIQCLNKIVNYTGDIVLNICVAECYYHLGLAYDVKVDYNNWEKNLQKSAEMGFDKAILTLVEYYETNNDFANARKYYLQKPRIFTGDNLVKFIKICIKNSDISDICWYIKDFIENEIVDPVITLDVVQQYYYHLSKLELYKNDIICSIFFSEEYSEDVVRYICEQSSVEDVVTPLAKYVINYSVKKLNTLNYFDKFKTVLNKTNIEYFNQVNQSYCNDECPICMNEAMCIKLKCSDKHYLCKSCISQLHNCPFCRKRIEYVKFN